MSRSANRQRKVSRSPSQLLSTAAAIKNSVSRPCRCQEAAAGCSPDSILNYSEGRCWGVSLPSLHLGIWMCRGRDMNVLVMDVEGTDGRERGEDQVCLYTRTNLNHLIFNSRILNANLRYSPLRHRKFLLSTSGSTKLVCIRAPIWAS